MIRAVLFDLDGTLADTAQDLASALNRLRAEHRMAPLAPELTRALASSGARGLLKVGFDLDPNDERYPPMRDRFLDLYEQALCVHTQLYEGMAELLGELERRALAWGIVTNKPRRFTDPLVRELRLHARAACVVSGDTTSKPKPAPDPLLHAAGVMRIAPQACLYVGDDLRDVQGARAAGMPVIAAGWGYLGVEGDPASWGADAVLAHPAEVLGFLD
ncbi:MAG: phosphoglycolate phosphatase [Betaproteobacteria bacterium RBG_16_64_18]|nr:MAG: phosphoglycolate phosphatase [Betaproteobacteria bacterium RBG_16_64_18]OGA10892.1 MAG: phosphoglycolate phosphatase [Betaproteobacteria bacterium RIFCSPLOWO2_02_FULL_65_20]OGA42404.1 MAG: phosphoglycolate phosphatase [Betaproteobacteria bacterium RIFCSPLOWO2_12_FULL_65_110]